MFFWSTLIHFDLLIYVASFYFIHTFITDSWPNWKSDLVIATLFIPLILFTHTNLNLLGFDFTNCWREALEGPLWQYYVYNAELFIAGWIGVFAILHYRKTSNYKEKKEIALATIGVMAMLLSFSFGNILGSFAIDWELGQYGLFGMPIFVVFLTYLLIRYDSFKARMLTTEALVAGLGVLIISLLFVGKIENVQTIAAFTFVLTTILGTLLIKSVRKEVKQRQEIERLAKNLEQANKRLKILDQMKSEFVSIASHQLRSPLTSIRGYASMLLEGSYGKLTDKAKQAVEKIEESSRFMSLSVEDYLNVSRIQSGNMKYEKSDFNLKDLAFSLVDEMRREALRKGLVLTASSDIDSKGIVNADIGKTRQILQNLIDNSMKYTPKGSIEVIVRDSKKAKRIYVDIVDTGIGMSEETLEAVFNKFERAHNANTVNVTGTGLGLYIARKMTEDMGGKVSAHSKGEGGGSTFTFEMPLEM